jgi:hypothetical protein
MWHGVDEEPVVGRRLTSGPFSLELEGPDIARWRCGTTDLIDRLYMSVRDHNWDTIAPEITHVSASTVGQVTEVTVAARNREGAVDFSWLGTITVGPGRLAYTMRGAALRDFRYCRIGFCLLLGERAAAGRPYIAQTRDGITRGVLPSLIAPQVIVDGVERPLFPSCSSFGVELGGVQLEARFHGAEFTSEDQRNWTDPSFKLCCVAEGYPHHAHEGQVFEQRVELRAATATEEPQGRRLPATRTIDLTNAAEVTVPEIGLSLGEGAVPLRDRERSRLKALALDHLRVDVHLDKSDWDASLFRGRGASEAIGAPLEVASFVRGAGDLDKLSTALRDLVLARVIIMPVWSPAVRTTTQALYDLARARLSASLRGAALIGGTDGDFAELNRDRPDVSGWDGVSYSINPQVHAFDDDSLVGTLPAQGTTVDTARSFAGSTPIVVSPITLRQRFNPSAIEAAPEIEAGEVPPNVDFRQMSLFGAVWTLGSIASLSGAGATAVTYYETMGWRGVMETDTRSASFPSTNGMVFPMYHVFADLSDRRFNPHSSTMLDPSRAIASLSLRSKRTVTVLVGNLSHRPTRVSLKGIDGLKATVRVLDEKSFADACSRPRLFRRARSEALLERGRLALELGPFAYARVDTELTRPA